MPIPQEKRNVSAINKSDLLLEMPQKEWSFVQCVCVYIYTHSANTVLGGRNDKGRKKGLVSAWYSKYQGREKDINSLTTQQDSSGGKEGSMRVDNKETTARLRLKEGSLKNLVSK